MPRPTNKEDLLLQSQANYEKLIDFICKMDDNAKKTPFDFSSLNKKEAHWKRDKNIRDVIIHLNEWQSLLFTALANEEKGIHKEFLMEGYNWKTYGDMNIVFFNRNQMKSLDEALKEFNASHNRMMDIINSMEESDLFTRGAYSFCNDNALSAYIISTTSSHYEWALKKLKAHVKIINGK